ncbi:MAG TPA: IPT/TIG domain-containing protein [Chryseolinea sp.]
MKLSFLKSMKVATMAMPMLCIICLMSCKNDNDNPGPVKPPVTPPVTPPDPPQDTTLKVTSISPATVHYGDTVMLTGNNFSATATRNTVTIGGVAVPVVVASTTSLKVVTPALDKTSNEVKIEKGSNTVAAGNITYTPDVFVAGLENNGANSVAKYWKNGSPVVVGPVASAAYSMYLSGNDIYVAGYVRNVNTNLATYWKNGTAVTLGVGESAAKSIFISGNDVHVSGWEIINGFDNARYWKNGTAFQLDPANSSGNGIAVMGSDAYVIGSRRSSQGVFEPVLWKNNEPGIVLNISNQHRFGNAIYISGGDIYAAGTQNNATTGLPMATYWKNGDPVHLTDGALTDAIATSIFVSGANVYVAGYEALHDPGRPPVAKYWKNGTEVKLTDGSKSAYANSIFVWENDVYVLGDEENPGGAKILKYWKNGTSVNLTDGLYPASGYCILLR